MEYAGRGLIIIKSMHVGERQLYAQPLLDWKGRWNFDAINGINVKKVFLMHQQLLYPSVSLMNNSTSDFFLLKKICFK